MDIKNGEIMIPDSSARKRESLKYQYVARSRDPGSRALQALVRDDGDIYCRFLENT